MTPMNGFAEKLAPNIAVLRNLLPGLVLVLLDGDEHGPELEARAKNPKPDGQSPTCIRIPAARLIADVCDMRPLAATIADLMGFEALAASLRPKKGSIPIRVGSGLIESESFASKRWEMERLLREAADLERSMAEPVKRAAETFADYMTDPDFQTWLVGLYRADVAQLRARLEEEKKPKVPHDAQQPVCLWCKKAPGLYISQDPGGAICKDCIPAARNGKPPLGEPPPGLFCLTNEQTGEAPLPADEDCKAQLIRTLAAYSHRAMCRKTLAAQRPILELLQDVADFVHKGEGRAELVSLLAILSSRFGMKLVPLP